MRTIAKRYNLAIVASIHQPSNDLLLLFDQLYVLARGGICVYSGTPGQVKTHLTSVPEIDQSESKYAIEVLIKHSCAEIGNDIVRKLCLTNNQQFSSGDSAKLSNDTHSLLDGVTPNRVRFSLWSVYILLLRYCTFIRGFLWKPQLAMTCLYLVYSGALSLFFEASIANGSGCVSLEDDFNNTCLQSAEQALEGKQVENNLKYNIFSNSLFLAVVIMQSVASFYFDLLLFVNEHRNGKATGSIECTP